MSRVAPQSGDAAPGTQPVAVRVLTFSTLYPDSARPHRGLFVETRLRHLVASGEAVATVVAPVPWVPSGSVGPDPWKTYAAVPPQENRAGIEVWHPRYLSLPKINRFMSPWTIAAAGKRAVEALRAEGKDFDIIDAHYFYPDGVAAAFLAAEIGKPFVITARGSDLNLFAQYAWPRKWITEAARRADGLIAVCQALKDVLVGLGIEPEKISVLRNGVDTKIFHPVDGQAIRARYGVPGRLLLSVGNLIELKGHDLVISALTSLPDFHLMIAGEGPMKSNLQALAKNVGVGGRVHFVGGIPQAELKSYYSAADALVLASSREGWANVLLESMACGTPVIATNVGGSPEVVAAPEAGVLVPERSAEGIAAAVRQLFDACPDRDATRRYAEGFSWDDTTRGQLEIFKRILVR